jgi:polysaccharide deacetylase 2 family uncharacterized protein YibQ
MRLPGYRTLGLAWAVALVLLAGGAGMLAWLGPLPEPPAAEAPAVQDAPAGSAATVPIPAVAEPPAPLHPPAAAAPAPAEPAAIAAPEPPAPEPSTPVGSPVIAPPEPTLLEPSRHGMVPRLGPENRTSIRAYARPFDRSDTRARIGIVINNIGLNGQFSEDAIRSLPGGVTLAFSPYAARPEPLQDRARARGMEMLVALPLEPQGFGQHADPGPQALLTGLPLAENLDRLDWALSRIQGQVGAIGGLGSMRGERFAANGELLASVQQALTRRGLLYVDPRPGAPQPERAFGRGIDLLLDEPSAVRPEVERQLAVLEGLARQRRSAVGLANNPTPSVVAAIAAWSAGLEERGAVVVPITVLIRAPTDQGGRP